MCKARKFGPGEVKSFWVDMPVRRCLECGAELGADAHQDARYCGTACRTDANNRIKRRGAELYHQALRARCSRNGEEMKILWRMIDDFRRADEIAGRPSGTHECYRRAPQRLHADRIIDPARARARAALRQRQRGDTARGRNSPV